MSVPGRATLVDHCREALLAQPDARTYRFLPDGEGEPVSLTNRELDIRVRAIAMALRDRFPAGERVLIVCPPGLDYVVAFFGALYAGMIAVPVYPPEPALLKRALPRLLAVIQDAQPAMVLAPTSGTSIADELTRLAPAVGQLPWLTVDDMDRTAADGWTRPVTGRLDPAFVQYTSGSTGVPKGVVVSHDNLLHNLGAIHRMFVSTDTYTHAVVWLPPYHDMGLVGGLLQPAYGGFPVTLMSPLSFLKRPGRWLRAISEYRGTHSGGPNFAYDLCVARIPAEERERLDLSSWKLAFTGAEPIRAQTMDQFARAFETSGFRRSIFYPCYGLAEGTLIASGGARNREPVIRMVRAEPLTRGTVVDAGGTHDARSIVGCGSAIPGQQLVIVDPDTRARLADGRVGEVWVAGPSVAIGYWRRPEETGEIFGGYLDTGEGPFLRTGDLGFMDGGELFVTGRRKDVIIIAGRNHYPQDIERSVEASHSALRPGCGVAGTIEVDGTERLLVVHEVDGNPAKLDTDGIISAIRAAVASEHELAVHHVVLVRRGKVPKTSSGKVQRAACRAAYLDGSLQSVASWSLPVPAGSPQDGPAPAEGGRVLSEPAAPAETGTGAPLTAATQLSSVEIERWLSREVAKRLNVPPETLDTRQPAASYGLGSLDMVAIVGDLEMWLGCELPTTLLWDYPTIEGLAGHLGSTAAGDSAAAPAAVAADGAAEVRPAEGGGEPVAIIGIGCRFPGGVDGVDSYWRMLCAGRDAVTEVPPDRWRIDDVIDDDPAAPGKMVTRWGGFLDQIDRFDAGFFGISPREAASMDPQQRLLAEVAWQALEDAGVGSARLAGSLTGVFVGISTNDYGYLQLGDLDRIDAFSGTGNALSIAANRLSYLFDLRGPSVAVDTACSSSLVAVHQASASLARGECSMALAGGVNVIISPALGINFSKAGAMAPDGRCKVFDDRADGYVRSEGAGVVVLKPLRQALADQDRIYGVILGSAINQDGRTNGLMAPSGQAQEAVLRAAYANAGVSPQRVGYVEAHGTGTFLGDPIEARALSAVVGAGRDRGRPCLIGSVKSNLGHLEAAAGIAGLIKAALIVRHRTVPPSLHFQRPNRHIPFAELGLEVAASLREWPSRDGPAVVGVSSFGFGGTNAHVVVHEAAEPARVVQPGAAGRTIDLLVLSARTPDALRELAVRYQAVLATPGGANRREVCTAAAVRRLHHEYRLACLGGSLTEFREGLAAFGRGEHPAGVWQGASIGRRRKVAFMFSGQGPRWWPLAADLLANEPFRQTVERCDELLQRYVDWSLLEQLTLDPDFSRLRDPAVGQPALCAVQLAVAALWRSWGVVPDTVVGHSVGEIAAAQVAGVLSLEDALRVAVHRGRVLDSAVGQGSMAVAAIGAARAERLLTEIQPGPVWVAASNGPSSTVFSGTAEALNILVETLTAEGIFCRVLDSVPYASHSPLVGAAADELCGSLADLAPHAPVVPMLSTVTGRPVAVAELDAGYWAANLGRPVLFDPAIATLVEAGHDTFVEISAHPMLRDDVAERLSAQGLDGVVVASLHRDQPGRHAVLAALSQLYCAGFPVGWTRVYGTGSMVSLPSYPWQRQRYWLDDRSGGTDGNEQADDGLLYRLEWRPARPDRVGDAAGQPAARPDRGAAADRAADQVDWPAAGRTWLVLADGTGVGDAVAAELTARGARCVRVVPGDGYRYRPERADATVRLADDTDLIRLLDDLPLGDDDALEVVHLWALDPGAVTGTGDGHAGSAPAQPGPVEPRPVQQDVLAQQDVCMGAVRAVQALVKAGGAGSARLWLVTRGAVQPADSPAPVPADGAGQSMLWGLGRSLQQEHAALWGGLVDLDPQASPQVAAGQLVRELCGRAGEDQRAIRAGRTYLARLVRAQLPDGPRPGPVWRPDASYLITGGLGGLGLAVARSMVRAGARRVVLLGRTGLPPRACWAQLTGDDPVGRRVAAVRALEALGASVIVESVDVADEAGMRAFLTGFDRAGWPPIRGVVHAAGVAEVAPLLELQPADLHRQLRPKVLGGWLLHQLFADRDLDFFVLFSSTSSILSSPFVASYAAANAFLDALAQLRRAQRKPAVSINWGIWSATGLAATRDETVLSAGMGKLDPDQALRVFHRLLRGEPAQVAVVPVDWARWGGRYREASGSALLDVLLAEAGEPGPAVVTGRARPFPSRAELLELPAGERVATLTTHLAGAAAATLGAPPSSVHPDASLLGLGLDSLMAVELRNELERRLSVSLPISVLLGGASVRGLAEQVLRRLPAGPIGVEPVGVDLTDKVFPLSEMQQSIWFFEQLRPGNPAYLIPNAVGLSGPLQPRVLAAAMNEIVRRHESLRTMFEPRDGVPMQVVRDEVVLDLPEVDAAGLTDDQLQQRLAELLGQPFDLAAGPLLRVRLLRVAADEYVLAVVMHHLISDGWSIGILLAELSAIYPAFVAGRPSPLPELPVQYRDQVRRQRRWRQQQDWHQDLAYWREHLAGAPDALALPTDRPRPPEQGFNGGWVPFDLPEPVARQLAALGTARGATTYMALLAVLTILLHRYSNQDDVVVGVPAANRDRAEIEPLIGCFVNMLPIRTDLGGDPTFGQVLDRVRQACLGGYAHQRVPFGAVVADLRPARDLSRHPIFQVGFSYQGDPVTTHAMAGVRLRRIPVRSAGSRFDLELQALADPDGGISGWFEYDRDLFDEATIARLAGYLRRLAHRVVAQPELAIGRLDLLADAERRRILVDHNDTARTWPGAGLVHQIFESQVRRTPRAEAVRFEGTSLTYRELNLRANQLANRLRRLGVGREVPVGVCQGRSIELVVSLLAVLKAGGAYLPLDPGYPPARLEYLLRDAGAPVLLAQRSAVRDRPAVDAEVLWVDEIGAELAAEPGDDLDLTVDGEDLAYVFYTSGSTGRPKGVMNVHAAIRNRMLWMQDAYRLRPNDRVLQKTPITFDVSLWEFFWPLMVGATLVLARPDGHKDGRYLVDTIRDHGITTAHFVPSMLQVFLAEPDMAGCASLRQVFCSGEALSRDLRDRFFARSAARLYNLYGPTEAAIEVSAWECRRDQTDTRPVPIGYPIANTQLYVLDRHGQPVPVGVTGELHIAGRGLARGYLNQPELTAQKFVVRSFGDGVPTRMFRTGDLARYRGDGALEYLGRVDRQVKLRGMRIELGEIESVLAQHERVREAVVTAREYGPGDVRLIAYLVGDQPPDTADLVGHLKRHLPDYMVPAGYVPLAALPLLPSGKVDQSALPEPKLGRGESPAPSAAPMGELERSIAEIWRDALGVERVGVHDNFFDLGGHSLLMANLRPRLATVLGHEVSMRELFQYPTIGSLTGHLRQRAGCRPGVVAGSGECRPGVAAGSGECRPGVAAGSGECRPGVAADGGGAGGDPAADPAGDGRVAIIGMAGRFPGARDIEEFWQNLRLGRAGIAALSDEELLDAGVPEAVLRQENYVKAKGVLPDADLFDAEFFGYSPREAEIMDPQQRVFLECGWQALESAGYDPRVFDGRIGVFAGASASSYLFSNLMANQRAIRSAGWYQALIANDKDFLATRVSFKLGLTGPSVTVQNACATSLSAVHLAVLSLLNGDCDIALAGGVSVTVPLRSGYEYSQGGILSADGHCRAFDAGADGTVAGNGVGIVVLRRLADARASEDRVAAVIRGSAMNNDGSRKASYTAPSPDAQAAVIERALARAAVDPATIGYVEAHGTGTPIGDAVEIAALTRAYQAPSTETGYCAIGSVKTSVGHLDAAAGVTSLIKAVLALEHGAIPATLDHTTTNPQLALQSSPFYVNTRLRPWPRQDTPRRAAVSSFGIGGSNVHVILEEAPAGGPAGPSRAVQVLPLSARSGAALAEAARRLADHLENRPDVDLADVAYTLTRRHPFGHREAVVCRQPAEAIPALRRLGERGDPTPAGPAAPVAFLFPGQGAQYQGMARDLYHHEPVFAEQVDRCAELFAEHLGEDLRTLLFATAPGARPERGAGAEMVGRLTRTAIAQPALFTVEYALARLWWGWGVRPQVMAGHSIGEYVAACLAGVFSLEDAVRLVAARGRLVQVMPAGAMLAVFLPEAQVAGWLGPDLCLAAVNSTAVCAVSGPVAAVDDLQQRLTAAGVPSRGLHTSHAFHSPSMDGAVEPFLDEVRRTRLHPPQIPFCSNVTGTWITEQQATSPEYWAEHLRQPVRFADAIERILADPAAVLVEVGPGQTLGTAVRQHAAWRDGRVVVGSVRHPNEPHDDREYLLGSLATLWRTGIPVDWAGYYRGERRRVRPLPGYPFQRQRYWVDPAGEQSEPVGLGPIGGTATGPAGARALDDWFYTPGWRRLPPRPSEPTSTALWVVLGADLALGRELSDRLAAEGATVLRVSAGETVRQDGDRSWSLDPASREHFAELVGFINTRQPRSVRLMHLWSLTGEPAGRLDEDRLDRAGRLGLGSLLALAQAIGEVGTQAPVALDVICRGVFSVTNAEPLQPENATLLGAGAVIPQEVPDVTCRILDITGTDPHHPDDDAVRAVHDVLCRRTDDRDLALRGRCWWVLDFDPVALAPEPDRRSRLRDGGVYLITGGLGGVGLTLAEHIAASVDRPVLGLLGRSQPPDEQDRARSGGADATTERLRRLHELGARVVVLRADVTDREQTAYAVRQLRGYGPINGIIHAAGVPSRALIMGKSPTDVERVLAAKTLGTLVLDQVCRDDDCDFVLLCSSVTSVLGGPGQADYCGANAFLDVFAEWKRREYGTPICAVGWDTWRGVGMAADLAARLDRGPGTDPADPGRVAESALGALRGGMTVAEGVAVFDRILAAPSLPERLVVSQRDLASRWRVARSITPSLLAREAERMTPAGVRHPRPNLPTPYLAPATDEERAVAAIWQDVLGIDRVGINDDLFALGGHSLAAVQIGAEIQRRLGVRLDLREFFEASTVANILGALAAARCRDGVAVGDIDSLHRDELGDDQLDQELDDELAGLSDDEVEARLRELLTAELAEQENQASAPHASPGGSE